MLANMSAGIEKHKNDKLANKFLEQEDLGMVIANEVCNSFFWVRVLKTSVRQHTKYSKSQPITLIHTDLSVRKNASGLLYVL